MKEEAVERRVAVERKEKKVNDWSRELELQKKLIVKTQKGLALKEKEADESFRGLESKEKELSMSLYKLELKAKEVDERSRTVELKEKKLRRGLQSLELKDKQTTAREKQVTDGLDALEVKVKQIEDFRQGIELRLRNVVELREKQLSEGFEALEVKAKDLEECCKVMDAKEMELTSCRRALELREQSIDELYQGLELNEKQINEQWQSLTSKEKGFDVRCQRLELKEKELNEGFEALELKDKKFDEECKEMELKKKEIYDQCQVVGAKVIPFISHERALDLREQLVDVDESCQTLEHSESLELKEKEFDEQCPSLKLKAKELNEGFQALESKERKLDEGYREMNLRKKEIDDAFEALEVKEKQIRRRHKVLDLTEQQINECCIAKESEDKLINEASSTPWSDDIQSLCKKMNTKGLQSYLLQHIDEYDALNDKMLDSLRLALYPAKLVLNVIQSLHELKYEEVSVRNFVASCIFLLVKLLKLQANITSRVKDEAREFTDIWRLLLKESSTPLVNFGYLQYLASFQLAEIHDADELLSLFTTFCIDTEVCQPEQIPFLCDALGLRSKITDLIGSFILKDKKLQAIRYICALQMEYDFPLIPLLRSHLENIQNRIEDIQTIDSNTTQDDAKIVEVTALKEILECISSFKLEFRYSSVSFGLHFKQLAIVHFSSIKRCSNSKKESLEDMPNATNPSVLPSGTQTESISNFKLESSYSPVSLESYFKQLEKEGEENEATANLSSIKKCSNPEKESVEGMPEASNPSVLPCDTITECISNFKLEFSYSPDSLEIPFTQLLKDGEENKATVLLSSLKICSNSEKESVEDMPKASNPSVLPFDTQARKKRPANSEDSPKEEKHPQLDTHHGFCNSSRPPVHVGTNGLIPNNPSRPPVHVGHYPSRPPVYVPRLVPNNPSRPPVYAGPYPWRPPVHNGTNGLIPHYPYRPPVHVEPYQSRPPVHVGTDGSLPYNSGRPPVHVGPYGHPYNTRPGVYATAWDQTAGK